MLKYFKLVFFFILSLIIPSNKNIIVFGDRSGFRFADNSRYLYILMNRKLNFKCIWLSKDYKIILNLRSKNFKSYHSNSAIGIYYAFRAKWHIFNHSNKDVLPLVAIFRNQINLWHSTPIKKLNDFKFNSEINSLFYKFKSNFFKEYLLLSNKNFSLHLLNHFPKFKYRNLITNLPRNIILKAGSSKFNFLRTDYEKQLIKKLKLKKMKVIGYFPTFREKKRELFIDFHNFEHIKKLNIFLKKNNVLLVFKKHQNSFREDQSNSFNISNDKFIRNLSKLSNFISLDYECDLNSVLSTCDLLITDYSGVAFDYLFLNKPIIFYCPDIKNYKLSPGLALDVEKQNFAYFSKNKEQFIKQIKNFCYNKDKFCNFHNSNRLEMLDKIYPNKNFLDDIVKIIK